MLEPGTDVSSFPRNKNRVAWATREYKNFDQMMTKLIKVPHSEIKGKLEEEKKLKAEKKKKKKNTDQSE